MVQLLIYEKDRTRQRFYGKLDSVLKDAREALEQGKPVQILPGRIEIDEAP